ncbi:hypothetical protein BIW11_08575 [Tropilaelaps mercedesae]|uniref:C2H2-type domain-containing protein n=1 Tax=Tropilaelaps mercedesae TaxID=418985 RepID=A0A1V9XPD6_9ACAR|nr:hypothetical protein BIW11_08575 [Tropilaelaps mercedesae]
MSGVNAELVSGGLRRDAAMRKTRPESRRGTASINQILCCNLCKKVLNNSGSLQQHVTSEKHKRKLLLANVIEVQGELNSSAGHANQYRSPVIAALQNRSIGPGRSNKETSPLEVLCKIQSSAQARLASTDSLVAKSTRLQQVLEILEDSTPHKAIQSYATAMSSSSAPFRCEPCGKIFSGEAPYAQHVVSEKHKKKLRSLGIDPTPPPALQERAMVLNSGCASASSEAGQTAQSCVPCSMSFANNVEALAHFSTPAHHATANTSQALTLSDQSLDSRNQQPGNVNDEGELVNRILEHHQRSFLLCGVEEPFAEFIRRHGLFERSA